MSEAEQKQRDHALVERYLDQPAAIPAEVRQRIAKACGGEAVQLYALADLDASHALIREWVALTESKVAIDREGEVTVIDRAKIEAR